MKKLFVFIFVLIIGINMKAQDTTIKADYPVTFYGEFSILTWDNQDISDAYGNMTLFGAGIEKKLSEDFKLGGGFNIGSSEEDGYRLKYSQLKAYVEYAWYAFGSERPNIIGGLGGKFMRLEEKWDSGSEAGSSLGFVLKFGVEIPIGKDNILGFGWNSTYANMEYAQENINVGSVDFYGKITLKF